MRKRKKLIRWRIDNDLKQVEIAKTLGISNGYYSNLEKGRVNPSFNMLVKFQETFKVDYVLDLFKFDKGVGIYGDSNTTGNIEEE